MFPSPKKTFVFIIILAAIAGIAYWVINYYPSIISRDDTNGYSYVKWEITEKRGTNSKCFDSVVEWSCIQVSQFSLLQDGQSVVLPNDSIATNPSGNNPSMEGPENVIDSSLDTKWIDFNYNEDPDAKKGKSTLVINMGIDNRIVFDGYRWATANDEPDRDPISWKVYGSNNGRSWNLLDERNSVSISSDRNKYTGNYYLSSGK